MSHAGGRHNSEIYFLNVKISLELFVLGFRFDLLRDSMSDLTYSIEHGKAYNDDLANSQLQTPHA